MAGGRKSGNSSWGSCYVFLYLMRWRKSNSRISCLFGGDLKPCVRKLRFTSEWCKWRHDLVAGNNLNVLFRPSVKAEKMKIQRTSPFVSSTWLHRCSGTFRKYFAEVITAASFCDMIEMFTLVSFAYVTGSFYRRGPYAWYRVLLVPKPSAGVWHGADTDRCY